MEHKKAIEVIKANWPSDRYTELQEALTMAIEALEHKAAADKAEERIKSLLTAIARSSLLISNANEMIDEIKNCIDPVLIRLDELAETKDINILLLINTFKELEEIYNRY